MTIEAAAGQVVNQITGEFTSGADTLQSLADDAQGQVSEIGSRITSQGENLRAQVDSLLARADEAVEQVTAAADEFIGAGEQAIQTTTDAMDQDASLLDSAQSVVETLDQGVQGLVPEADSIASTVEQTINTMAEDIQSREEAMDEVRVATEEHLQNQFSETTQNLQQEIFDRGEGLGDFVNSDLLPDFASEVESFKGYADEVVDSASQKLDELSTDAETRGEEMVSQVQDIFGEEFGSLIETAETVADLIDQVGQAITGTTEVVGTSMETLSQGVNLTAVGAKSAIGIVEDIIEIFNSVT